MGLNLNMKKNVSLFISFLILLCMGCSVSKQPLQKNKKNNYDKQMVRDSEIRIIKDEVVMPALWLFLKSCECNSPESYLRLYAQNETMKKKYEFVNISDLSNNEYEVEFKLIYAKSSAKMIIAVNDPLNKFVTIAIDEPIKLRYKYPCPEIEKSISAIEFNKSIPELELNKIAEWIWLTRKLPVHQKHDGQPTDDNKFRNNFYIPGHVLFKGLIK